MLPPNVNGGNRVAPIPRGAPANVRTRRVLGRDRGLGYYRDPNGVLTYKGTGSKGRAWGPPPTPEMRANWPGGIRPATDRGKPPVKPGSAPAKPPIKPGAPGTDALGAQLDAISGYNLARAGILGGISDKIGAAYGDAGDAIAGYGQGLSGALRDSLTNLGNEAAGSTQAITGNYLTPDQYAQIKASYNPGAAADIGYGIGAMLPAKSLREQGAAFQAAASFLPAAALQQGAYALASVKRSAAEAGAAAGAPKASASLSKTLGYLADVYGNPIVDKKGRKIPVDSGGLTAYQEAQLKLSQQREERYIGQDNFRRWKAQQDIRFRSSQEQRRIQNDLRKGKTIDSAASKVAGHIVYKDGSVPTGKNGKPIPISASASSSSPKAQAQKNYQKAISFAMGDDLRGKPREYPARPGWFYAKAGATGNDVSKGYGAGAPLITSNPDKASRAGGYTYAQALQIVKERFGISQRQARRALFLAGWKPAPKKKPPTTRGGLNPKANLTPEQRKRYEDIMAGRVKGSAE